MFGSELALLPDFNSLEKLFIRLYGSLSVPTVKRFLVFKHFVLKFFERERIAIDRVLDFGCAFGGFGFALARLIPNAEVCLFDINPEAAKRCRTIIKRSTQYSKVRFLDEDEWKTAGDFRLTLAVDVIEHIENDRRMLEELYWRMAPGGCLYVAVPQYSGEELSAYDRYVGHVRTGYERNKLESLLADVGFTMIAEPGGRWRDRERWFEPAIARLHKRLATSPDSPLLDFDSLPGLALVNKAGLALLWPLYRTVMEFDIIMHGNMANSISLLAQK